MERRRDRPATPYPPDSKGVDGSGTPPELVAYSASPIAGSAPQSPLGSAIPVGQEAWLLVALPAVGYALSRSGFCPLWLPRPVVMHD